MNKTRLSLCMIVKNEEEFIGQCLNSTKDIVDEIIIVDTGSTDKTIEICKSFDAKIEKFEWNGSFADARNFGLEKATGDWILWLDADEEVDKEDAKGIFLGTHFVDFDALTIRLVNYYGEKVDKNNTTDLAHTRLFRRGLGIKFINKIHESLDLKDIPPERIGHLNMKVFHYGYLDPIVQKKEKYERNIKLLKQQINEGENIPWAYYYIGMEHYRKKKYNEAFEYANLSIRSFLEIPVLPPSMVYKLKYSTLIAMGSFEGAWPGIEKAIALYPDYVDLRFFKGIILYYLEEYESSLQSFEECIEMGEDNINHLVLRGVGSFQAWYYKAQCLNKLGKTEESIVSFLHSLAISPQYQVAIDYLRKIISENGIDIRNSLNNNFEGKDYEVLEQIIQGNKLI